MKSFICSNHTFRGAHAHRAPPGISYLEGRTKKGTREWRRRRGESSAFNAHRTNESFPMSEGYSAFRLFLPGTIGRFEFRVPPRWVNLSEITVGEVSLSQNKSPSLFWTSDSESPLKRLGQVCNVGIMMIN